MEEQMRRLEGAAYCAVLRAFYAQSAHFTVERMDLLETLRIELNIPATEYLTQLRKLEQDERLKGLQQLAATRTGMGLTLPCLLTPLFTLESSVKLDPSCPVLVRLLRSLV
eukprot:scaffold795_cov375-Prasinococcus_capsulatus_cf.AAC.2